MNESITKHLNQKSEEFKHKKNMHFSSLRKMKKIYYILGITASISSTMVSFITGIKIDESFDSLILVTLILSLMVSILGSIITFSNIVTKIENHRDCVNKYAMLVYSIDNIKLHNLSSEEILNFLNILENKIENLSEYEELSCCFKSI